LAGQKVRTLFCITVGQNFFDLSAEETGPVWQAVGEMMTGIAELPGAEILGTLDDDQTMVGPSSAGFPTAYVLADLPDREAVAAACNLFRTTPVGDRGHRLWKYLSVEARMGRALEPPQPAASSRA